MPREVTDAATGTRWTCIQAFAGLSSDAEKSEAARVDGTEDRFHVVCTPGGAHSVRIELHGRWEEELANEQLVEAIQAKLAEGE